MELKWGALEAFTGLFCSNRTFMELKCDIVAQKIELAFGSNRTFMELK